MAEEEEKGRVEQVPTLTENEPEDTMQTVLLISQSEIQAKRKLHSLADGKEIPIGYFPFLIGKNRGLVDLCLNEPGVSRLHAKIERDDTGFFITDLNSTNGTKVNGVPYVDLYGDYFNYDKNINNYICTKTVKIAEE